MSSSSSSSSSPCPSINRPYIATRRHRFNVYNSKTPTSKLNSIGFHNLDPYQWKDDELTLRTAAAQSRLPHDRLSKLELKFFLEVTKNRASTMFYLFCRNKILVLWNLNPIVELTVIQVMQNLAEPFNSDPKLIESIHAFLQRYGYINFGVFLVLSNKLIPEKPKIIVIGAGAAGLGAARQLQFFGFDVVVLEARTRIGGRVMTYYTNDKPADLGAQIIMGITGNPIVTLAKQLPITLIRILQRCPVFDYNGKMVDARKDDMIQKCFNKILSTCAYVAHGLGITEIDNCKLSLGEAFDCIINQEELRVLEKKRAYFKRYFEITEQLRVLNKKLLLYKLTVDNVTAELQKLVDFNTVTYEDVFIDYEKIKTEIEFAQASKLRTLRYTLSSAIEAYDDTLNQKKELERVFSEFKYMEPSEVYMNLSDKRILDFHLANLEYGIGASIYASSLKDWDHDDDFAFDGSHLMVKEGYSEIIYALAKDLNVQLESVVNKIEYNESGVKVTYKNKDKETVSINGEAVICTIPLGVLKRSLFSDGSDALKFEPPLPKWKQKAILSLGFGSLNKIVLIFESIFWESNLHTFARLNELNIARGELFLFFTNGETPVLTGLLAGEAANYTDKKRHDFLVNKAMNILQNVFGSACPKKPLNYIVTVWHMDKYARGSYSFVGTNSSAEDYDVLARPLFDKKGMSRVCFAGEHTNRQYTATVHGAYLSGLREAARIADMILGPIVENLIDDFLESDESANTKKETLTDNEDFKNTEK